jgi:hypothetical protein
MRKTFGPMRDKVVEGWNLHTSLNIVRVIKSRMKTLEGHVACLRRDERYIQNYGQKT